MTDDVTIGDGDDEASSLAMSTTAAVAIDDPDIHKITSLICAIIMLVCCVFGVFGNSISIYIFTRRQMHSSINCLLAGLSAIDLLVVLLAIPSFCLPSFNVYVNDTTLSHMSTYNAVFIYPLACIAQTGSIWIFVLITGERFCAVCHPFLARKICTTGRAKLALLVVCIGAAVYNIVRFFEYQLERSVNDAGNSTSNVTTSDTLLGGLISVPFLRNNTGYYTGYYTALFLVTHFLLPFSVIVVLNTLAMSTISKAKRERKQLSSQQQSEHKTTWMMIVVILMFLVCNVLPFVLNLVEAIVPDFFDNERTLTLAFLLLDLSNTLVVLNSASTCCVYYFFSQKYRKIFRRKLGCFAFTRTASTVTTSSSNGHSRVGFTFSNRSSRLSAYFDKNRSNFSRAASARYPGPRLQPQEDAVGGDRLPVRRTNSSAVGGGHSPQFVRFDSGRATTTPQPKVRREPVSRVCSRTSNVIILVTEHQDTEEQRPLDGAEAVAHTPEEDSGPPAASNQVRPLFSVPKCKSSFVVGEQDGASRRETVTVVRTLSLI